MTRSATNLVAVDIGNSRMKLGRLARFVAADDALPEPEATFELPIDHATGRFDNAQLAAWCGEQLGESATWIVASVHRDAAIELAAALGDLSKRLHVDWPLQQLTYHKVPLELRVDAPERTGIDRLLAAVAANRLRRAGRAAIIVDVGTAITVDLVDERGAFCGGAILPGIAMAARALDEQTDALPRVPVERLEHPPAALGKSTIPAIESGLFWGAVGAIRELVRQLSASLSQPPDVFLTGGASPRVAEILAASERWPVRHEPHLVLAGIVLVGAVTPGSAGG